MRISDWSSDVCSSDLHNARADRYAHLRLTRRAGDAKPPRVRVLDVRKRPDRKSVVEGKSVSVSVDLGGRRNLNQNKHIFSRRQPLTHTRTHECTKINIEDER